MSIPTPLFQGRDQLASAVGVAEVASREPWKGRVDEGIAEARTRFWRALGQSRVAYLQGLASNPVPSTDLEQLRELARQTEVKITRRSLVATMQVSVSDDNSQLDAWNDIPAFRSISTFDRRRELERLDQEIEDAMDFLRGAESAGAERKTKTSLIGAETVRLIGDSVR